jgi:hypothetical protein
MAIWYPSRRILRFPAWLWVVSAILLFLLVNVLMDADIYLTSSKLPEPPERNAITSERIIVAHKGALFRFVPAAQYDAEEADLRRTFRDNPKIEPRWGVYVEQFNEQEDYSCGASSFVPGLIHRESRWTYDLRATRADYGWWMEVRKNGIHWKGDKENPFELPPEQIRKLRPLVVAELNRRHPGSKLGDRLKTMLDEGLETSSTSYAPQNTLIMMRWLALLMAVVGLGSMFIRPRAVPAVQPCTVPIVKEPLPMSEIEVLLIKIAEVRERLRKRYREAC